MFLFQKIINMVKVDLLYCLFLFLLCQFYILKDIQSSLSTMNFVPSVEYQNIHVTSPVIMFKSNLFIMKYQKIMIIFKKVQGNFDKYFQNYTDFMSNTEQYNLTPFFLPIAEYHLSQIVLKYSVEYNLTLNCTRVVKMNILKSFTFCSWK